MWQDWVVFGLQWIFIASLFPTVFHATQKPAVSTSIITALGMFTISGTYLTLNLYASTLSSFLLGVLWVVLAVQQHRLNKTATNV